MSFANLGFQSLVSLLESRLLLVENENGARVKHIRDLLQTMDIAVGENLEGHPLERRRADVLEVPEEEADDANFLKLGAVTRSIVAQ